MYLEKKKETDIRLHYFKFCYYPLPEFKNEKDNFIIHKRNKLILYKNLLQKIHIVINIFHVSVIF